MLFVPVKMDCMVHDIISIVASTNIMPNNNGKKIIKSAIICFALDHMVSHHLQQQLLYMCFFCTVVYIGDKIEFYVDFCTESRIMCH